MSLSLRWKHAKRFLKTNPLTRAGVKIGAVIQPMKTRGSSTLSVTTARRSSVMGAVWTFTGSTSGPRGIDPKYFSIHALVVASSKSPTIEMLALLGA